MELNKVYCMNALDGLHMLEPESIDLILTDPPYGMAYQSNHREQKHKKIEGDDDLRWLPVFVYYAYRALKPDSQCYVFCSKHNMEVFLQEFKKFFELKNVLVWNKNNWSAGDLEGAFADRTEFILFLTKGKSTIRGRRDDNVLVYDRTNNELHPTQKPEDLIRHLIKKSTDEGAVVLDPFLGSGTTAIACQQLGRQFIAFEIDPEYVTAAEKRLKQKTLLSVESGLYGFE